MDGRRHLVRVMARRWTFFDPTGVITGLLFVVIAVGLVWRYGAANLSWRDRVVAEPPDQSAADVRPAPSTQTADEVDPSLRL